MKSTHVAQGVPKSVADTPLFLIFDRQNEGASVPKLSIPVLVEAVELKLFQLEEDYGLLVGLEWIEDGVFKRCLVNFQAAIMTSCAAQIYLL